ncbi:MAG: triose-phosphate isomerase [Thiomicrospira sp.]|nr:triose-phosphate isomerase [Thiomicrospira sp.]
MRKPFVAGNWKMHGDKAMIQGLLTELVEQQSRFQSVDVAVCPPSIYIAQVQAMLDGTKIEVGGQNIANVSGQGAYTGELSAQMFVDNGCKYIIVGHSERRTLYGETDSVVAEKVAIALAQGLVPILCVGETFSEREEGITELVVERQIQAVLEVVGVSAFTSIVIAYEPVWAIGTGLTATPEQAQAVHAYIRGLIARNDPKIGSELIIQYGGSVKPDNAKALFSQADIDGGLIGGASLSAKDFVAICELAGESCLK